tara:strand:+ start:1676 stop:2185 length:510 start_codon:yes stop_codon:yes gene_type:complete
MIDMQEKLVPAMHDHEALVRNCRTLLAASGHIEAPLLISEQYPQGLGPTLAELSEMAGDCAGMAKMDFSCARDPAIQARLKEGDRRQIVICGVEAHVCVLQTALDLRTMGLDVFVALDAVASRQLDSKMIAADRLRACGVHVVTVEMVVFEWAQSASDPVFKSLRKLIL